MAYFIFSDTAKFCIVRKNKKHRHSGESRNLFPLSTAAKRREISRLRRQFAPSARRFLPSQEWN
ncbi:MAG: hypothetical protein ACR2QC_04855 [Gammaproteobacteria bacterium]